MRYRPLLQLHFTNTAYDSKVWSPDMISSRKLDRELYKRNNWFPLCMRYYHVKGVANFFAKIPPVPQQGTILP